MNSRLMAAGDGVYSVFNKDNDEITIKSDNDVFFNKVNISEVYEYIRNPDRALSRTDNNMCDEWFFVNLDSLDEDLQNEILELFNVFDNTGSYPNLSKDCFLKIKYFFYGFDSGKDKIINIQNIKSGNLIKATSFFEFGSSDVKYKKFEKILKFYNKVDIFIEKNRKKIYFQDFNQLKYFNGKFIEIYKEATEEDYTKFKDTVNQTLSLFSMNIQHSNIRSRNSKKLKYILDNNMLEKFKGKEESIRLYMDKYGISSNLEYKDNKFIIKENKHLTSLIEIFFEQHYTGAITEQHLLASGNEIIENS